MALIKCSECEREISDKAKTCPGCGAPINGAITDEPVQTIQITSKKLKKQYVIANLILFIGFFALIYNIVHAVYGLQSISAIPIILIAIGIIGVIIIKFRIWWQHE
jgi:hypothetical protein